MVKKRRLGAAFFIPAWSISARIGAVVIGCRYLFGFGHETGLPQDLQQHWIVVGDHCLKCVGVGRIDLLSEHACPLVGDKHFSRNDEFYVARREDLIGQFVARWDP